MRGFGPVVVAALLGGVLASPAAAQEVGLDLQASTGPAPPHAATIVPENASGAIHANLLPTTIATTNETSLAGNPLWAVPLRALSETVARPVFSPSRRPRPHPVLAAPLVPPTKPLLPPAAEPDHPLLTLLGTIVGKSEGIGVFLDETSHDVIRLKTGEAHAGWILRAVRGRAADFERSDHREATLVLSPPGTDQAPLSLGSDVPATERAGSGGNDRISRPAPENRPKPAVPAVPAATKGKFKRTPREL